MIKSHGTRIRFQELIPVLFFMLLRNERPCQGKIPLKLPEAKAVRLKYVSPEGWVGYSPPFLLEPKSGATLQWQR